MGNIIGIDLGTTYSCIAHLEGQEPKIIPNLDGQPTTPSVVSFTRTGEKLIGYPALRQAVSNIENTVFAVKRLIGRKFDSNEASEVSKKMPYKLAEAENGDVMVSIDSNLISPQEISSLILGYLKECAESYFGENVSEAVVTVPAHFNDHQRQATIDAAKIAGLEVLRIINEPTSASLAYGFNTKNNATVAVYDMGGGTFDITLMEINEGVFHVLATNGNSFLGGEDFDIRIADWLVEDFKKDTKIDLSQDKIAYQRIKEASEKSKRELSFLLESEIHLPFIGYEESGSKHLKKKLTRKWLEGLTKDLIRKTLPYIEQALQDSKLEPDQIDGVILVGGQTRMPLIKRMITEYFGKDLSEDINPDEIVAMGAAIQSGILKGKMQDITLLLDVTSLSLGIETENDTFVKIIERNSTIPTRRTMPFTTVEHNQRRVKIHVLQGESRKASENKSLATFSLMGIESALAGIPQIDVTFEIDADGIAKVSARDIASGREQRIEVKPSAGLTKDELDQIIQKSEADKVEKEIK